MFLSLSPAILITEDMVTAASKKMKQKKAGRPSGVTTKKIKLGIKGISNCIKKTCKLNRIYKRLQRRTLLLQTVIKEGDETD